MEFLVNLGDWSVQLHLNFLHVAVLITSSISLFRPLVKRNAKPVIPMFSWCGSTETADIVMPTYDITEASLECMGR